MSKEAATETPPASNFNSSKGFLATMEKVVEGERNPDTLEQTAVDTMENPLGDASPTTEVIEETPAKTEETTLATEETVETTETPAEETTTEDTTTETTEETTVEDETPASLRDRISTKPVEEKPEETAEEEWRGPLPTDTKGVHKRIKQYEGKVREIEARAQSAEEEAAALKTQLEEAKTQAPAIPEDLEEKLTRLTNYDRLHAMENDPVFKEKFQSYLDSSNDLVDETLGSVGVSEEMRNTIKEKGGISAFIRSNSGVKINGEKGEEVITAGQYISMLIEQTKQEAPDAEAILRAEIANQAKVEAEKKKFVKAETEESKRYFKNLEEQAQAATVDTEKQDKEITEKFGQYQEVIHNLDWMKPLEIAPNTPADKQKEMVAENKFRANVQAFFDSNLALPMVREAARSAKTTEEINALGQLMEDSAYRFVAERNLEAANKRITELEAELDETRSATSTTTPSNGSGISTETVDTSGEPKIEDYKEHPLQFAIEHKNWAETQKAK